MGGYDVVRVGTMPSTPPVRCRGSPASMSTVVRPKIKIIHIIAPEIIKTDAANFRDLVQRLTGKQQQQQQQPADGAVTVRAARLPPVEEEQKEAIKKRPAPAPAPALAAAGDFAAQQENKRRKKIKCEVVKVGEGAGFGGGGGGGGGGDLDHGELWMDLNPGGFLSFLEEDVFLGMAADPDFLQPLGSSRMDLVGEMCASYLA